MEPNCAAAADDVDPGTAADHELVVKVALKVSEPEGAGSMAVAAHGGVEQGAWSSVLPSMMTEAHGRRAEAPPLITAAGGWLGRRAVGTCAWGRARAWK